MNTVIEQIKSFLEEPDMTAALANLSSLLKETYPGTNWTGFYYVKNKELILVLILILILMLLQKMDVFYKKKLHQLIIQKLIAFLQVVLN